MLISVYMEDNMQRYLFFAVIKGARTGVYTSWEDVREQVCNSTFPKFHGFNSYQQAVLAFHARLWCVAAEKAATLEMIGSSGDGFYAQKGGLPVIPAEELNVDFGIVNSMEEWLVKLCYDSEIPGPCFFKQEMYLKDQGPFYGFTVVVPGEPYEVELSANGRFSTVEKAARKDAAMEMLGRVLDITDKKIRYYNYLKVKLLRDSNNALRAKVSQLEDDYTKLMARYEAVVNAHIERAISLSYEFQ